MYPNILNPAHSEIFQLENRTMEVPKCILKFQKWNGTPVKETFGGKPILTVDGEPMFAEMALASTFINDGWQARWLETTGRKYKEPMCIAQWEDNKYENQKHAPIEDENVARMLNAIVKRNNNSYAGCWDVIAWKDGQIIFAEAKRNSKDIIRQAQINWLSAALSLGLTPDNFLVVQWEFNPRCM